MQMNARLPLLGKLALFYMTNCALSQSIALHWCSPVQSFLFSLVTTFDCNPSAVLSLHCPAVCSLVCSLSSYVQTCLSIVQLCAILSVHYLSMCSLVCPLASCVQCLLFVCVQSCLSIASVHCLAVCNLVCVV